MSEARWVTFDCFGTLVDWRHGIATAADIVAPGRGAQILEAYNRCEPRVQAEAPKMRYRRVLAEGLRRACVDVGVTLGDDDAEVLGATMPYWPVFPDARAELAALREDGWSLALLTNCDRDIIAETQRRLPVPFDAVVTAEDAGAYKPAHNHFVRFERSHHAARDRWVHVAQSYFHDMVPARELGIPRVWINRLAETDDPSIADAVLPDLRGLFGTVARVHADAGRGRDGDRDRDRAGRPRNARPRDELGRPMPRGAAGVEGVPDDLALSPDETLAESQRLLDAGRAFQAHEVLEAAWKSAPDGERELWRGLAQLAVGITHALRDNPVGAAQLLRRAADRVEDFVGDPPYGVDAAGLVGWARALAVRIDQAGLHGLSAADLTPRLASSHH